MVMIINFDNDGDDDTSAVLISRNQSNLKAILTEVSVVATVVLNLILALVKLLA